MTTFIEIPELTKPEFTQLTEQFAQDLPLCNEEKELLLLSMHNLVWGRKTVVSLSVVTGLINRIADIYKEAAVTPPGQDRKIQNQNYLTLRKGRF